MVAVPFLFRGTRPRKPWVLVLGFAAAVVMMTLAETRSIVGNGEAPDRIAALLVAGEHFLHGGSRNYGPGREFVMGTAEVQAVQRLQNWDWGGFLWNVVAVFPPHQLFPNKIQWQTAWGNGPHGYLHSIRVGAGLGFAPGCATAGFSDAFVQFWWFFPIFWFILGHLTHRLYTAAVYARRQDYQCYLVVFFVVLLYLVAQGLEPATFNALFTLLPAWLAYRYARVARVPAARSSPLVGTGASQ